MYCVLLWDSWKLQHVNKGKITKNKQTNEKKTSVIFKNLCLLTAFRGLRGKNAKLLLPMFKNKFKTVKSIELRGWNDAYDEPFLEEQNNYASIWTLCAMLLTNDKVSVLWHSRLQSVDSRNHAGIVGTRDYKLPFLELKTVLATDLVVSLTRWRIKYLQSKDYWLI